MSFGLGSAHGQIVIDYNGAGVQQAIADLNTLASLDVSRAMQDVGRTVQGVGQQVSQPFIDGFNAAADFEFQMDAVNAALGGLDGSQMEQVSNQALQLGADTKYSANEIAGVQEALGKSGITMEKGLLEATEAVTDMAAATGEDLVTSGEAAAAAVNLFGLEAEQIPGVADTFTAGLNNSSASLADFTKGVNTLGPVMTNLAMYADDPEQAFTDTAAAVAYFNSMGLKAADAGVSLARGITNLSNPTDEARATMEQLGIAAFDVEGNFIGLPALFDQLNASMAGMSDEQREAALATIFGAEAADVMNLAIKEGGDGLREYNALMESQGQAAEQAAIRQGNFKSAVEQLGGALESLGIDTMTPFLDQATNFVNVLAGAVEKLIDLPAPIQTVAAALGAIGGLFITAAGGALLFAGHISESVTALRAAGAAMAKAGLPLSKLALGFSAVGLAIGAGILAYQTNFLGFADLVDSVFARVTETIDAFGNSFNEAFSENQAAGLNDIAAGIAAFGTALNAAFGVDWTDQFRAAAEAVQAFGDAWATDFAAGAGPVVGILDGIGAALRALGFEEAGNQVQAFASQMQKFGDVLGQVLDGSSYDTGIARAIEAIGVALREVFGLDITGFTDAIAAGFDAIGQAALQAAEIYKNAVVAEWQFIANNVAPGLVSALGNVLGTIKDVGAALIGGDWSKAGEILGNAMASVAEWAGNVVQGIGDALGQLGGMISQINFGEIASTVGTALSNALSTVGNFLGGINWSGVLSAIGTTLQAAIQGVGSFLTNAAATLGSALTTALQGISQFLGGLTFQDVVQYVSDLLMDAFNTAGDALGNVAATLGSALTTALQGIGNYLTGLNFGDLVTTVVNAITSAFGGGGGQLSGSGDLTGGGSAFAGIASSLGSSLASALNNLKQYLTGFDPGAVVSDIVADIQAAFDTGGVFDLSALGKNLSSALETACGIDLTKAFDALSDAAAEVGRAMGAAGAAISGAISSIKATLEGIDFTGVFEGLSEAAQEVGRAMGAAQAAISGAIGAIKATLEGIDLTGVFEGLSAAAQEVGRAMSAASAAITGGIQTIKTTLEGLDLSGVFDAITEGAASLGRAMSVAQSAVTGALTTIKDAIADITFDDVLTSAQALADGIGGILGGILTTVTNWVGDIVAKIGEIATAFSNAFNSPEAQESLGLLGGNYIDLVSGQIGALTGNVGSSDQAKKAMGQAGDFAVNFIAALAESFRAADWSPLSAAINEGISGVLSGAYAGEGGPRDAGPSAEGGLGQQFAANFVQQIVAGFTPEVFAPIKEAFYQALDGALQLDAGSVGTEGGDSSGIGTYLVTGIAQSIASAITAAPAESFAAIGTALQAKIGEAINTAMSGGAGGGQLSGSGDLTGSGDMSGIGQQLVAKLAEAITTADFSAIGTAFQTGLQTPITEAMTQIGTTISEQTQAWSTALSSAMMAVTTAVRDGMLQVSQAISDGMTTANTAISTGTTGWSTAISSAMMQIVSTVQTNMQTVSTAISTAMSEASTALSTSVGEMTTTLQTFASDAATAGTDAGTGFADGISTGLADAEAKAQASVDAIKGILDSAASTAYDAGVAVGQGFADGISSMEGAVRTAAEGLANAAAGAINAVAKISSPSKVTEESGMWFGQGFANGIQGTMAGAAQAGYSLGDSAIRSLRSTLEDRQSVGNDWMQAAASIAQSQAQYRDNLDRQNVFESEGSVWLGEQELGRVVNRTVVGGMLRAGITGGRNNAYGF